MVIVHILQICDKVSRAALKLLHAVEMQCIDTNVQVGMSDCQDY